MGPRGLRWVAGQVPRLNGPLPNAAWVVTVPAMRTIARLLQLAGLTIPPLAMVAQLLQQIKAIQMLQFLFVSVCLFSVGYLMQLYSRPPS